MGRTKEWISRKGKKKPAFLYNAFVSQGSSLFVQAGLSLLYFYVAFKSRQI